MLAAACSGPGSRGIDPVPSTTTSTTVVVSVPGAPIDPWSFPLDHQVSAPTPPIGPLPSFNESPGCDASQGIRGPFAASEGPIPDGERVWGPWGGYFGRDIDEVRSHLVEMSLPNGEAEPVTVYVHERAAPALQLVIDNLLREQERGNVYPLDPAATSSFNPRTVPPWRYMSFHTVGIAIDVNSLTNPYRDDNTLITDMPGWFVKAWTDAGWCWGGSWLTIKDPMHFSWKGPRYTPGYGALSPMPIRTMGGGFDRSLTMETALDDTVSGDLLMADIDRDGALDLVSVMGQRGTGRLEILAARAIHRFDTCWVAGPTPYSPVDGADLLMADADGDGRPDLWVVGPDDDGTAVVVYTHASGYTAHLPVTRTDLPFRGDRLLEDLDGDGYTDLWVVDAGAALLAVWAGPDFDRALLEAELPADFSGSWRFATGDRSGDGVPDLFALGTDRLVVFDGSGGFLVTEEIATPAAKQSGSMQVGDFDGDGRADLYVLGDDGGLSVYLGGQRTVSDGALMTWFYEGDDQPWEHRQGCPFDPTEPR